MKKNSIILVSITVALVFLTSCLSRENLFQLANDTFNPDIDTFDPDIDTFDPDMNILFPGSSSGLSFGAIPVFTSEEITVTIENNGNLELVITGLIISGEFSDQFNLDLLQMSSVVEIGGATTFKVSFQPYGVSNYYATVVIKSNDPENDTYEFPIFGESIGSANTGPEISVRLKDISVPDASGSISFGNIETNELSLPARFTIENNGDSPLTIFDISINSTDQADFTLDDTKTAYDIEAGNSTTVDISFAPLSDGSKSSTLTIESNDPDSGRGIYTFTVSGIGSSAVVADINVAPENDSADLLSISGQETFDYGTVYIFDSKTHRFIISNAGTGDLTINNVSSNNALIFSITGPLVSTLSDGEGTFFEISLQPGSAGLVSALISIDTNGTDPDEDPYTFNVVGTRSNSMVQDITVRQTDLVYDVIPAGEGVYDFGDVEMLSFPVTKTFTVENTGGVNLTINQPVSGIPEEFAVSSSAFTSPILPGSSSAQTFDVTFNTLEVGGKSTVIAIASDDPDFASEDFSFTVTGTAFSINEPEMDVYQGPTYYSIPNRLYNFGDISVNGSSASVTFTIYNTGNADLVIGSILLSKDIEHFLLDVSGTSFIVSESGSTTFNISFAPLSSGTKKARLIISNNDSSEDNFKIKFEGRGI
ncbi:MAG TPA: choice-of-anchor D domain-containing protein [Spirochaetes bacterium]|nr:choice-of-anchor D domain-containing protein [Spirochaetota bacterium]